MNNNFFWSNFVKLCNKQQKKPNPVAKELGFSSGSVTGWKKGVLPRDTALRKIADYFGVTVDELLENDSCDKTKRPPERERSELEKEFSDLICDLSDEQGQTLLQFLRAWKKDQ